MRGADFIIVGQGIAGSCLAFELLERGASVSVIDDDWRGAACLVAAGVINPITGQRLVKSWRSSVAHPYARGFYQNLESRLCGKFFHDRKILQLCKSPEESELWRRRAGESGYAEFMSEPSADENFGALDDSFGAHFIGHSAWVEPPAIMRAFRDYFIARGVLEVGAFDFTRFSPEDGTYRGEKFKKTVFCDGWRVLQNPYFSWLPYRPAKGEILTMKTDEFLPEHIIHRGNWIMKNGANTFRIGSTWEREKLDCEPTDAGEAELLKALPRMFKRPIAAEVQERSAGVRPCTATTRPHLGEHPNFKNVLSFNGFGSKGYALSPYFAKHFADWIYGKCDLDSEANLTRHLRKFWVGARCASH